MRTYSIDHIRIEQKLQKVWSVSHTAYRFKIYFGFEVLDQTHQFSSKAAPNRLTHDETLQERP